MATPGIRQLKFDDKVIAAMRACIDHARNLLSSAQLVQQGGHPNIAYHLATLALEEIGRRELIGMQSIESLSPVPPAWPGKHTQDHVKKLFWCFFGCGFLSEKLTRQNFEEMVGLARRIHDTRLAGLYVDQSDDGLGIPSEAITKEDTENLLKLCAARLAMAESEKLRDEIPEEEIELQIWFLKSADDPERRKYIFSGSSLAKLGELKDTRAWGKWLKEQFDKAEADARAAAEQEIQRSRNAPEGRTKDKWKMRIRILCASHSIRPKALSSWNEKIDWIKLVAVSSKKKELIIELILGDNVPVQSLWFYGWGLARHIVVALNIGTMGFWWWRMPEQISRYYESLEDLETGKPFVVERNPSLKIDWGENRVLTEQDLARVAECFAALPGPDRRDAHGAYNFYIGGLTFLSLNDIHWQCEVQAFGNFFESLRAMMEEMGHWKRDTSFEGALLRFFEELFPGMEEQDRFAEICKGFERREPDAAKVTLKEVSFMKLFCDAYFLNFVRPRALLSRAPRSGERESPPPEGSLSNA